MGAWAWAWAGPASSPQPTSRATWERRETRGAGLHDSNSLGAQAAALAVGTKALPAKTALSDGSHASSRTVQGSSQAPGFRQTPKPWPIAIQAIVSSILRAISVGRAWHGRTAGIATRDRAAAPRGNKREVTTRTRHQLLIRIVTIQARLAVVVHLARYGLRIHPDGGRIEIVTWTVWNACVRTASRL
jgi:hypothetical protein